MKEIIGGYRIKISSRGVILKGLQAVLLISIRFSQRCDSLEQRWSSCRE